MRTINPEVLHMNIKNCLGKRDNPFGDAESEQSDNSSPIKKYAQCLLGAPAGEGNLWVATWGFVTHDWAVL